MRVRELARQACPQLPAGRYLIRPDGYIGWADTVPDQAANAAVPDQAANAAVPDRAANAAVPDRTCGASAGLVEALGRWFGKPDLAGQPEPAAAARR